MSERIQKFLANQGVASRREIERWIRAGDIKVDGKLCSIGQSITGDEEIEIHGQALSLNINIHGRIILYHKPEGEIVSRHDPQGRPTVFKKLPHLKTGRWVSVGRLDINTSGLLLFTTDGALANEFMHPRNQIEREYRVRVQGHLTDKILSNIQHGVQLEDGMARLEVFEISEGRGSNIWCSVVLREGRNREVRKIWESQGLRVSRLIRTRFGPVELPREVRPGRHMHLTRDQYKSLKKLISHSIRFSR